MSNRSARAVVLVIAALLSAPIVLANPEKDANAEAALCPGGLRTMEDVGLVCPQENGLFEVFSPTLESLGYIHGGDPIPAGDEVYADDVGALGGTNVHCVDGAAGTYFIQVIYARASNDADGYATWLNQIRWMVGQANKLVDDAGIATGSPASLKVKCVGGQVEVKNEVLPTAMASASFSTITTDLRNKGYTDGKVKYWVFYDDTGACTCGGQGNVYGDDTLAATNKNNGNQAAMFAITYGYNSTRVMLHELGHNMGAVQNSAPYTTGAWHCYDGRDTMCYNDNGPNGHLYSNTYCTTEVFDCNKNTYFHTNPAPGSYLATKWNLGNPINRFIAFGMPTLTSLVCPSSAETDQQITCTFVASDDGTGVKYTVNWGDGSTTTVPPSGFVTPGATQSASKTYTSAATRTVSVTVEDNSGFTGNTLTQNVNIVLDNPTMNLLSCSTPIEIGATTTCSVRASDLSSGVKYTVGWGDGTTTTVPSSGFVAPGVTQTASKAYASAGARTVSASATDVYGHAGSAITTTVNVISDPPVMNLLTCNSPVEVGFSTTCNFRATDGSSGVKYTVNWGDGTTTTVPSSGTVAPGVTQSATKTYSTTGIKTVTVTPTDVYNNVGAASNANVDVQYDLTPPTLTVNDPRSGTIYYGCGVTAPHPLGSSRALWVDVACVKATATDAKSGVNRVEVWVGGTLRAVDTTAPYVLEFPVPSTATNTQVQVRAYDNAGNLRTATIGVDMVG